MSTYSWQPAVPLCQVGPAQHFCSQYEVRQDILTVFYTPGALRTARG